MAIDPTGGRKELERLLASHSKRTQQLAQRVAKEVAAAVSGGAGAAQAVTQSMERAGVSQAMRTQVAEAVVQSLCVGNGIWPSISATVDMPRLSSVALGHSWDGSGMTLSARLYGTDQAMRSEIIGAVQAHITAGDDTWKTARKIYDGYGFGGALHKDRLPDLHKDLLNLVDDASRVLDPTQLAKLKARAKQMTAYADRLATGPLAAAYRQLSSELEKDLPKGVARLARIAAEEKARYHASRILRTESAQAWGQGFHAQCMADSDVTGWRWETSSAHVIIDICDFHARADLYGMGPGIYPKTHHPRYPAHPHCLCQCSMVFKGETPAPSEQVDQGGKAALNGMSESERARLLGKSGANSFRGGGDWRGSLRNWTPSSAKTISNGATAVLQAVAPVVASAQARIPFKEAATLAGAEKWARDADIADRVSYKGLSVKAANAINKTVSDHLEMFPKLRKGLQFVGTAQERDRMAKAARKADGWSDFRIRRAIGKNNANNLASSTDAKHTQFNGVHGIAFNEKAFGKNFDLWEKEWPASQSGVGKFHPPGKDLVTDVTAHELGHQIDALYGLRTDSEVQELWNAAKAIGVRESISGYALKKGLSEGIAEGWAEAYGSSSPRSFASGLRERILKLMRGSP